MTAIADNPDLALSNALADWKKSVVAELKGVPFEKRLVTPTPEGIAVQPLYTRLDLGDVADVASLPGQAPFLRGLRHTGGGRFWQSAQRIESSHLPEYNAALRALLQQGQDAVLLRTARPDTGLPDDVGDDRLPSLPVHSVQDFSIALEGVDLEKTPIHLETSGDPRVPAALYLAFAQDRGVSFGSLRGSIAGDIFSDAALTGTFPHDLGEACDAVCEWTRWAATGAPQLQTVSVDAALWSDAGATGAQELAVALGSAAEYLRLLLSRGLSLDVVAPRIRFRFASGPQFFSEIAKLRAFRPLWSRVISAFGGPPALAAKSTVSVATSRWNKTLLDAHVNLLRSTTESLSAVLGGCDCLEIAAFDAVSGRSSEFSRRTALNVHTLMAEEFGFAGPADPAGGSWYVEKLTHQLALAAWGQFQDFERRGGIPACLRSGYAQQLVGKAREKRATDVATRRTALVGTNLFPNLKETPLKAVPPARRAAAQAAGSGTHPGLGSDSPESAPGYPPRPEWSFPVAIHAALQGASDRSLVTRFRGISAPNAISIPELDLGRAAEGYEALRRAAEQRSSQTGFRPRVFLAKMGPPLQHKARADFANAFFSVGGFEVLGKNTFADAAAAAAGAAKSGADVTVLCSTDDTYPELAPAFATAVKAANPRMLVVLAGLPSDAAVVAAFRDSGFDDFIHARANAQQMLGTFLSKLGTSL